MALEPRASLLLLVWWVALHALLGAAVLLVGWPWPVRTGALLAVSCHAVVRRPRPSPKLILVGADARCAVPEWQAESLTVGARTLVCPYWIRLDLGTGLERRDILLLPDQFSPEEWARLRSLLARTRCA